MGSRTDAKIAAWQKEAGIEPASGERADTLGEMSRQAYNLIQVVELERSGIRDGDGFWHGSNPLDGILNNLMTEQRRLCNATSADPSQVRGKLEEARDTLDNWGHGAPDKTPLVSLLYHEIVDAMKGGDLGIMQNALRAFNEYMARFCKAPGAQLASAPASDATLDENLPF